VTWHWKLLVAAYVPAGLSFPLEMISMQEQKSLLLI